VKLYPCCDTFVVVVGGMDVGRFCRKEENEYDDDDRADGDIPFNTNRGECCLIRVTTASHLFIVVTVVNTVIILIGETLIPSKTNTISLGLRVGGRNTTMGLWSTSSIRTEICLGREIRYLRYEGL
jgi:hypothetical protein